jgi:hypothetical protein
MRFSHAPNRRAQDGPKGRWLCLSCEQKLNVWETEFATKIFHLVNAKGGTRVSYGDWLLKFCVSVSWRSLLWLLDSGGLTHFTEAQRNAAGSALNVWRRFLLGEEPNPRRFEQHLLPLDTIQEFSGELPPNFNRYVLRGIEIDAVQTEGTAFVSSKIGRFIVFGFLDVSHPRRWVGTKIHLNNGTIEPQEYTLPIGLHNYLIDRAKRHATVYDQISDRQRLKIDETFRKNLDRVAASETFRAMTEDVRLFGNAAFSKREKLKP